MSTNAGHLINPPSWPISYMIKSKAKLSKCCFVIIIKKSEGLKEDAFKLQLISPPMNTCVGEDFSIMHVKQVCRGRVEWWEKHPHRRLTFICFPPLTPPFHNKVLEFKTQKVKTKWLEIYRILCSHGCLVHLTAAWVFCWSKSPFRQIQAVHFPSTAILEVFMKDRIVGVHSK